MSFMLNKVVEEGTGKRAMLDGVKAGGKTGTTNAYRDAWFVGFTGNLVGAVWMGNDDHTSTNKMTGGSVPAMLWREVMAYAHQNIELKPIPYLGTPGPEVARAAASGAQGGVVQLGQPTLGRAVAALLRGARRHRRASERRRASRRAALDPAGLGPRRRRPAVRDRRHARGRRAHRPALAEAAPPRCTSIVCPAPPACAARSRERLSERRPAASAAASAVLVVYALLLAAGLGLSSAYWMTGGDYPFGAVRSGAWTVWPRAGSRDADPYTRAVNARTGGIPLGVGEGLVLRAAADDAGRALDARCAYRIGTTAPQARYWTLALYDETGRPVETPLGARASRRPRSSAMRMAASRSCSRGRRRAATG